MPSAARFRFDPSDASRAAQVAHLTRLNAASRYPLKFFPTNPDNLAKQILALGISDSLAKDYARAHGAP